MVMASTSASSQARPVNAASTCSRPSDTRATALHSAKPGRRWAGGLRVLMASSSNAAIKKSNELNKFIQQDILIE
jgi:hypothetical protein